MTVVSAELASAEHGLAVPRARRATIGPFPASESMASEAARAAEEVNAGAGLHLPVPRCVRLAFGRLLS
jgi:hypothetical protein